MLCVLFCLWPACRCLLFVVCSFRCMLYVVCGVIFVACVLLSAARTRRYVDGCLLLSFVWLCLLCVAVRCSLFVLFGMFYVDCLFLVWLFAICCALSVSGCRLTCCWLVRVLFSFLFWSDVCCMVFIVDCLMPAVCCSL